MIRAYLHADLPDIVWEATFTDQVPAEFIAAFLTDVTNGEPLDPDRDEGTGPTPPSTPE